MAVVSGTRREPARRRCGLRRTAPLTKTCRWGHRCAPLTKTRQWGPLRYVAGHGGVGGIVAGDHADILHPRSSAAADETWAPRLLGEGQIWAARQGRGKGTEGLRDFQLEWRRSPRPGPLDNWGTLIFLHGGWVVLSQDFELLWSGICDWSLDNGIRVCCFWS